VDGTATIDTIGSTFDTVLAVYSGPTLETLAPVARDDSAGSSGTSWIEFYVRSNQSYQVAVAGAEGARGFIALNLRLPERDSRPAPVRFTANWPGFHGGPANDIEVAGNLAYLAIGEGGLLILDVLYPLRPRRVSSLDTPGEAKCLAVADGYVPGGGISRAPDDRRS
jgi:hypothetical protein